MLLSKLAILRRLGSRRRFHRRRLYHYKRKYRTNVRVERQNKDTIIAAMIIGGIGLGPLMTYCFDDAGEETILTEDHTWSGKSYVDNAADDFIACLPSLDKRFDIFEDIGCGGYGVVKRAYDKQLKKIVSIKIMPKKDSSRRDVLSEVKVQRVAGSHKNINALLDVVETDSSWIIVLEYLGGGELFDRLIDRGAYSEREASETIRKVGTAIRFLHANGIVHGDIKPENIMLSDRSENAHLEIIDFGMAFASTMFEDEDFALDKAGEVKPETHDVQYSGKLSKGNESRKKTQRTKSRLVIQQRLTELHLGTTAYAPNEVLARDKDRLGSPIDMWALGILTYILLSGVHPFDPENEATDTEIERRIKANEYNFDDPIWESVSPSAIELIRLLLSHNTTERPTIDEALSHPWLADDPGRLNNEPLPELVADNLRKYQRGRRRLRASILAVLLGLQNDTDRLLTYMNPKNFIPTIKDVGSEIRQSVATLMGEDDNAVPKGAQSSSAMDIGSVLKNPVSEAVRQPSTDVNAVESSGRIHLDQSKENLDAIKPRKKSGKAQLGTKRERNNENGMDCGGYSGKNTSKLLPETVGSGNPSTSHVFSRLGAFDREQKGFISAEDLKRVSKDLGEELSEEEVGEMIHASDQDSTDGSSAGHVRHSDVRRIIAGLRVQRFGDGDLISKEGDIERIFYLLLQGQVERSFLSANGKRIVVDHVYEGEHFGESELLRTDGEIEARSVTCRCVSGSCEVLTFPQNDIAMLTDVFEGVEKRLQRRTMRRTKDVLVRYITRAMPGVREEEYPAGSVVVNQGEVSDHLFVIVSGEVEVEARGKVGKGVRETNDAVTVEWLGPGDFFPLGVAGILQSFSRGNKKRGATVRCVTPVRLVRVEGQPFREFLKKSQVVYESVEKDVLNRLKKRNMKAQIKDDEDDEGRDEDDEEEEEEEEEIE